MTAAGSGFIAGVKLKRHREYPRDPALAREFELEVLKALSTANVRDLVMAALPLPDMAPARARDLVVTHLVNRAGHAATHL